MAPLTSVEVSLQQLVTRLYEIGTLLQAALYDLENATTLHRQATQSPTHYGAPPTLIRSETYLEDEEDWSQTNDEAPHTQRDLDEEEGHHDGCGC